MIVLNQPMKTSCHRRVCDLWYFADILFKQISELSFTLPAFHNSKMAGQEERPPTQKTHPASPQHLGGSESGVCLLDQMFMTWISPRLNPNSGLL